MLYQALNTAGWVLVLGAIAGTLFLRHRLSRYGLWLAEFIYECMYTVGYFALALSNALHHNWWIVPLELAFSAWFGWQAWVSWKRRPPRKGRKVSAMIGEKSRALRDAMVKNMPRVRVPVPVPS